MTDSAKPIAPITLPNVQNPEKEEEWLRVSLHTWLDLKIAQRAAKIFVRQRLEGENDLGSLVIAIIAEMRGFDFSRSFYSEFAVANAVSDLILNSLGIDRCCGE
jgi:hypothetical protein